MTKLFETVEVSRTVATAADNRLALLRTSVSHTPRIERHTWVSREEFIRLMLSHQKLRRCDDRVNGLRGLMAPGTGDHFFIKEDDLFEPQTAEHAG